MNGTSLVLIYSELLDESSVPAAAAFTVNIGSTDHTPTAVTVSLAEVPHLLQSPPSTRRHRRGHSRFPAVNNVLGNYS